MKRKGDLDRVGQALWIARVALAGVWGYEGLWLKVLARDPDERAIVAHAVPMLPPLATMLAIGVGETALALAVLFGRWTRPLAWLQLGLLLAMHGTATFTGSLPNALDLWAHCLPIYACVIVLILLGERE